MGETLVPNRCKTHAVAASLACAAMLPVCLSTQPATAFVLQGILTNVTFDNGLDPAVTASGSFDFDTVANTYSNINISMSDGVTFTPTDTVGGDSTFMLVQKSPTTANLSLLFFAPLTSLTPPDFVGLTPGPNTGTVSCLATGSCYALLGTSTFRPSLVEESIDVVEVPAPPALVGTLVAGVLGLGSRWRKRQQLS